MDNKELLEKAKKELKEELEREEIDRLKVKLRKQRKFIDRIIPFKIVFIRKENLWKS